MMKLLFFSLIFLNFNLQDPEPCDIEVSYRVEHTSQGRSNGKIYIEILEASSPFELNLYDMNTPERGFIKTVKFESYQLKEEILVFQGLEPSTYIVRIDNNKCKSSISGLDGITIN